MNVMKLSKVVALACCVVFISCGGDYDQNPRPNNDLASEQAQDAGKITGSGMKEIPCWKDPYTGLWTCPDPSAIQKDLIPGDPDQDGPGQKNEQGPLPEFWPVPVPPDPH